MEGPDYKYYCLLGYDTVKLQGYQSFWGTFCPHVLSKRWGEADSSGTWVCICQATHRYILQTE
jgi:hypothetical protein